MAAYVIARVNVTDWDQYNEYIKVTPDIIARYGGRFIVRGGETVSLEGPEEKWRIRAHRADRQPALRLLP